MQHIATAHEMSDEARKWLPHSVYSFVSSAAHKEQTKYWNNADFRKLRFRQKALTDISEIDTSTTLLGCNAALPVGIAPTGMGGIVTGGKGEIPIAKGAQAVGIPYTLGWLSISSIEEVAAACEPFWFQILFLRDRGLMESLVRRAEAVGAPVLVLTVSSPTASICPRFYRLGLSLPPRLTARAIYDFALKPRWSLGTLLGPKVTMGNLPKGTDLAEVPTLIDKSATWKDVAWLRKLWKGKLLIKGIGNPADAVMAVEAGADGVVVSTHGGFQLDSATSSISVLPHIVEAVDGRCEVLLDSGVRSGQDILKAVALGARGCLLGRLPLYAAGAHGQKGVEKLFELISHELTTSAGLTGTTDVKHAGPDILWNDNLTQNSFC